MFTRRVDDKTELRLLEAYANGRQCVTKRIYPFRPDILGVRLFPRGGGAYVSSFQAWDMAPTHQ